MAVEENFLEHVPLSCLSPSTIKELGVLLDPAVLESDVRRLADLLGYDYSHVRNLEDRPDRTKYFFDSWWGLRPDFTVLKLKECLEIMEREDIIADIWPQIERDARAWERHVLENKPKPEEGHLPVMTDDSWKLTIHDIDRKHPARYNACLCYEEDDIETAEKFENELTKIHSDLKFFVPHLHVMPGKYIYDCVAQVIDERCNKKVVIILPKKEFTDATCDFALQYARALDPSAKQGNLIPVIGAKDIHTPRVLLGVSGIRMFMKHSPLLWRAITNKLGVRISSQSSDSSYDTESSPLCKSGRSLKSSTSSSDTHESDEGLVADINSKLYSVALQDNVTTETPCNKVEEASKYKLSEKYENKEENIAGKKKKKGSSVVRLVYNVRRRLHRKQKKRACESSMDNVAQVATDTASESIVDVGVIVPVVRDNTVEVPSILQGVAAIRFHRPVHPKIYEQTADLLKFSSMSEKRKPKGPNTFSSSRSNSDSIYIDKKKYSFLQRMQKRLVKLFFKSSGSRTSNVMEMRSSNSSSCSIEESPTCQNNVEFLYIRNEESDDGESPRQRSMSLNDLEVSKGTSTLSFSRMQINADVHINVKVTESSSDESDSVITESTERSSTLSINEEECSTSNTNLESHRVSSDSGTS